MSSERDPCIDQGTCCFEELSVMLTKSFSGRSTISYGAWNDFIWLLGNSTIIWFHLLSFPLGMIVLDQDGHVAAGTSTNGLTHKVPGYVEYVNVKN